MNLNWSLLLDVIMIAMMAATMVYAFVLNRNLERLRTTKAEFETVVQKLVTSVGGAEKGLRDLKLAAQEVGSELEGHIASARGLSHELQFMIESADSLANRLSRAAESPAQIKPPADAPKPKLAIAPTSSVPPPAAPPSGLFGSRPVSTTPAPKTRSRAEAQLLEDLGRVAAARADQAEG